MSMLENQQYKVKAALEQTKDGYDNAQKAVEKHRSALASRNKEIEEAQLELEQLKKAYYNKFEIRKGVEEND